MQMLFVLTMVLQSVRSINEEVRWLQFVQRFQTQLNLNSSIDSLPMCTTWISNNYQSTSALDRTLENIEKWGKHCISKFDCISGHISFQNQGLSVTEQLDAGVRRLVLELHFVPGLKKNLRLCASLQVECTAMKKTLKVKSVTKRRRQYNWCKGFMMMSRGIHTGCHSGSPQFKDIIREIIRWLNKNQDQFIVVDIVDFVSMEKGCELIPEIDASLKLFGSRLLKPNQRVTMKGDKETLPSHSELMAAGKSAMFRSTCTFGGMLIFPARKSDYVSLDNFSGHACNETKHPSPFTLFYHDKIHVDVILSQRQRLRQYRTEATPDRSAVQAAARCNAPVALQTSNYSDLFACSWTWFPYNDNIDCTGCTAFNVDMKAQSYGWINTNCSRRFHLPCRTDNGTYTVTRGFHYLPNTLSVNGELCGQAHFALPLNPREASNLATEMWKHGLSHVWLPRIPLFTCTTTVQYISCGRPLSPSNGLVVGEDFGFDGVVRFECNVGYNLVGADLSVCHANGSWSGTLPSCKRVDCGQPRQPLNGRTIGDTTDYGSMFGYTCNWGYVFEGQANTGTIITTCQDSGKWDVIVPDCIQRQCEVSEWSDWGQCSLSCASGTQSRSREIVRFQGNEINGNCPPLEQSQVCNVRPCDTCTTREYTTNIEADQCRSAEAVVNRYCSGACREKGKCCRPTMRSTHIIILFCDDSRPRNFQLPVIEKCGCMPCG